jgi:hypothetical protein
MMQRVRWQVWVTVLALGILSLPLAAQGPKAGNVDYAQVRASIQKFEMAIGDASSRTFNTLGIVGKPKGVFLQGYGYMYSVLINLRWGIITNNTPFGPITSGTDLSPEDKRKQVDSFREQLLHVMFAQGSMLPQLEKDKCITIAAFLEEMNPDGMMNKTIILTVLKSDLDELANRPERFNDFKQRVKSVEY